MNKITAILFFLFSLSSSIGTAQTYFSNRYEVSGAQDEIGSLVKIDSNFYSIGISSFSVPDMLITKFDTLGNLVDTNTFGDGVNWFYGSSFGGLEKGFGNEIVSTGAIQVPVENDFLTFYKFNTDLDTIVSKRYGDTTIKGYLGYQVIKTQDSCYMIVGTSGGPSSQIDPFILKVNQNGDSLWLKEYEISNPGTDKGYVITETPDKGFIIGGTTMGIGGADADIMYFKVDSLGIQQWIKFVNKTHNDQVWGITQLNDGNFALCGGYNVNEPSNQDEYRAYIRKIDGNGGFIWEKQFHFEKNNYPYKSLFYDIEETSDGDIIAAGHAQWGTWGMKGMISKVDANGDSLWTYLYDKIEDPMSHHKFYGLHVDSITQNITLTGSIWPNGADTGTVDIWIKQLDPYGCDTAGCHTVGFEEYNLSYFEVYPNPSNGIFNIYIPDDVSLNNSILQLYDITGKLIKTFTTLESYMQVDLSDYQNGLYYAVLVADDRRVVKKLIKQ